MMMYTAVRNSKNVIQQLGGQDLLRRTLRLYLTVVHDHNPIRTGSSPVQIMQDKKNTAPSPRMCSSNLKN